MSARPRLLDAFCCAGGATKGYQRAGFHVTGIDVAPQPNYCGDAFIQGDALEYLADVAFMAQFAAVHASPPCQDHSMLKNSAGVHGTGWLLDATLGLLRASGIPWVVENVVGSGLLHQADLFGEHGVMLCGATFGLGASGLDLNRHRLFQSNATLVNSPCSHRPGETLGVYGHGTNKWHREKLGRNLTVAEMREAMGVDWTTREELSQAIPPAYTEHLGAQLLSHLAAVCGDCHA